MAPVITLAPIATQLSRSIALSDLFPPGVVERALRDPGEGSAFGEPALPKGVEPFFAHFRVVVRAATQLLGAPGFAALARFHEDVQEEYMPGGPPQSPVYDSFAMQLVLGGVRQGIGEETPYTVLSRLLARDPSRARLQGMAQSLAEARFELYRVRQAGGHRAELEPVRGGDAFGVRLTGPFLRQGDFGLMRILRFDDQLFIADSPYLLKATEDDWREHLARVVARHEQPGAASRGAVASESRKASKLSSKEQARRRQKEKARAQRNEPEEVIKRYFQFGLSDRYWLDYVMDGYAGERNGIVFLAGVPDRPELLPHSAEYQGDVGGGLSPVAACRTALLRTVKNQGLLEVVLRELRRLTAAQGAEGAEPSPNELPVLAAYATYGLRASDGTTVLERYERSQSAPSLHPEVRAFLDSVREGWFSVARIDRIHLDEGLEVFDLFREQALRIRERSATRQLALGDLVLGWLCKDRAGTLTFEGGLAHLPALLTGELLPLVAMLRRAMPPLTDERAWKDAAADLPLPLIAAMLELRANPRLPELVNTSGDRLELITSYYRVCDPARVRAALSGKFLEHGDGSYGWVDPSGVSLARLELSGSKLRVEVNSQQRLEAIREELEALLGDAVARSLEAHQDVGQAVLARQRGGKKARSKAMPSELSPELAAQVNQLVLEKLRSGLDEAIPQFRGKTLRQLARSTKDRPDAISWLREQERILRSNPQLAGLDLRPLWQELGLPYQGLETDPPMAP